MRDQKYRQQIEQLLKKAIEVAQHADWNNPAAEPTIKDQKYFQQIEQLIQQAIEIVQRVRSSIHRLE